MKAVILILFIVLISSVYAKPLITVEGDLNTQGIPPTTATIEEADNTLRGTVVAPNEVVVIPTGTLINTKVKADPVIGFGLMLGIPLVGLVIYNLKRKPASTSKCKRKRK